MKELVRGNLGRRWRFFPMSFTRKGLSVGLLLRRYQIPTDEIEKLISVRLRGMVPRALCIIHRHPQAPQSIYFLSSCPAAWFKAFELYGIPTEDPVRLQEHDNRELRIQRWCYLLCVFLAVGIFVGGLIAYFMGRSTLGQ